MNENLNEINYNDIPSYEWKDLPNNFSVILSGISGSGKNIALNSIINEISNRKFTVAMLFSSTCDCQFDSFKFIPDQFKHNVDGYEEKIDSILDYQDSQLKKHKGNKSKVGTVLLILDDILNAETKSGASIYFSKTLKRLFTAGRHFNVSFFLLTQGLVALPPLMKQNAKVIGLFKSANHWERKAVIDKMMSIKQGNDSRKEAYTYLNSIFKEPHNMLIVAQCNIQRSCKLTDYCFKYRANIEEQKKFLKKLKLGKKCFWN